MKRVIALVAILSLVGFAPVQAAERPTTVKGCKEPVSKARTPAALPQPTKVDAKLKTTMTIQTNCGPIILKLNPKAPQTVTNMTYLASRKFFDGTFCHRLTTEGLFVLQCGDPTASGGGGPTGWKGYADENLPKKGANNYPAGTLAMANSGKNTNGSQFFLVYGNTTLGPDYTIWGTITTGLPLLKKIANVGAYKVNNADGKAYYSGDGFPIQPVEILKVTVR